jgi:ATP-dependent RNA helicase DDX52/ROK1
MDNSIFKSLTCGVKFKKQKAKSLPPKTPKLETIKFESDSEDQDVKIESPPKKKKKLSEEYLRTKKLEEVNKIRKQHNIIVKGMVDKIKPITTFDELFQRYPMNQKLVDNIRNFKYSEPTPVQMQVLPLFLEQKALKVTAPTGSGKSLMPYH